MAKKKGKSRAKAAPVKPRRQATKDESDGRTLLDRATSSTAFRALTVLLIVAGASGWILARPALEQRIASYHSERPTSVFDWPVSGMDSGETWLPEPVRRLLTDIAESNFTPDPFDRDSLEAARTQLLATGWFRSIERVQRRADGSAHIVGRWRSPAAVVRRDSTDYLVATGGQVLRLPPSTPVAKGSMPLILNPIAPPPRDSQGLMFGKPWTGGDVQAAIALLAKLHTDADMARIVGVDLSEYLQTGRLTLLTDAGARIVWGAPIGAISPGEVTVEKKLANLRDILRQRLDARHGRIEIFPPVVLIDKTSHDQPER